MEIKQFECQPEGPDVIYMVRISVYNGINGYEGPCQVSKDKRGIKYSGQTRVVLPLVGPVSDLHGIGIFGFTHSRSIMYEIIKGYAKAQEQESAPVKWQVLSALNGEVEPDPERWDGAFMTKRAWVCFSGDEFEAWKFYHRAKLIQSYKRFLGRGK